MKFKIEVNGKTDFIYISKEKATKLGLIKSYLTGYERARSGETYYVVSINGVMNFTEDNCYDDTILFDSGNYFTSEEIAQCVSRATTLKNMLRKFQADNDRAITSKDWKESTLSKWHFTYNYANDTILVLESARVRDFDTIYFTSKELCEQAVKTFESEIKWYYKSYLQRLDEVKRHLPKTEQSAIISLSE